MLQITCTVILYLVFFSLFWFIMYLLYLNYFFYTVSVRGRNWSTRSKPKMFTGCFITSLLSATVIWGELCWFSCLLVLCYFRPLGENFHSWCLFGNQFISGSWNNGMFNKLYYCLGSGVNSCKNVVNQTPRNTISLCRNSILPVHPQYLVSWEKFMQFLLAVWKKQMKFLQWSWRKQLQFFWSREKQL